METCKICHKKYISQEWLDKHIEKDHPVIHEKLSKGWQTPFGFIDFNEPVTYEVACVQIQNIIKEQGK